jgi:hypothetical protein
MGFVQTFGGTTIYPSQQTYLAINMTADVELAWPIEQQMGGLVVADILDVTASAPGLNLIIPDARQVTEGYTALFNNVGSQTITIQSATGATLVSLLPGTVWQIYLTDNTTESGVWRTFQYGASVSVANAAALAGAGLKAISTTLNQRIAVQSKAANYVMVDSDRATAIVWTAGAGAFTVPAPATVGADWFAYVKNLGSGDLTLTPTSGTIDSAPSQTLSPGEAATLVSDGSNFIMLGIGGSGSGGSGAFDFVAIDVSGAGTYTLSGIELNKIGYRFTGTLTGTRNIVVPGTAQEYWVDNETTGAFSLFVKTVAQVPGVEVLQSNRNILYCDGTNVIAAESATVSFPIPVAQGGTGAITAAAARTNLGATTIGSTIFTSANAAAVLSAISGAGTAIANIFTSAGDAGTNSYPASFDSATPIIQFRETDASADNKRWNFGVNGEIFFGNVVDDAGTVSTNWLLVDRTGTTVDSVTFPASILGTKSGSSLSAALRLVSATPAINFYETDAAANNKSWDFVLASEQLLGRISNDADNVTTTWLAVDRTSTTVDSVNLLGTDIQINGTSLYGMPQNAIAVNYTLALTDRNKHVYTSTSGVDLGIPANGTVAFPTGSLCAFVNDSSGNCTVTRAGGVTLYNPSGVNANLNVASHSVAFFLKVAANTWYASGAGVS